MVKLSPKQLALGAGLILAVGLTAWSTLRSQESTLEIRPIQAGGVTPDGFYIWHHLDANGIAVKSITPQKNMLVIKFTSSDQGKAAQEVLKQSLPQGYVTALCDEPGLTEMLLSRIKSTHHRLG